MIENIKDLTCNLIQLDMDSLLETTIMKLNQI